MRIRKLRKKVNKLREGGRTVGSGKVATIIIKWLEVKLMPVHHGGKTGKAGRTLQNPNSSKSAKSNAAKVLNQHKKAKH